MKIITRLLTVLKYLSQGDTVTLFFNLFFVIQFLNLTVTAPRMTKTCKQNSFCVGVKTKKVKFYKMQKKTQ